MAFLYMVIHHTQLNAKPSFGWSCLLEFPGFLKNRKREAARKVVYCHFQPEVKRWFGGTDRATEEPIRAEVTFHGCSNPTTGKCSSLSALPSGAPVHSGSVGLADVPRVKPRALQPSSEPPGLPGLDPAATAQPGLSKPLTPFCLFLLTSVSSSLPSCPVAFSHHFGNSIFKATTQDHFVFPVTPGTFCQGAFIPAPASCIPGKPCPRN